MLRSKDPAAVALGRKGGKVKSEAKAAAARENGKRPKRKNLEKAMKVTVIASLMCLLSVATASAQSLKLPTIVLAGAATADLSTTFYNLSNGTSERNPLLRWTKDNPTATVIAGAVMTSTAVWLAQRHIGRRHPKLVATGLYVAAGISTAYAINNYRTRPR